MISFFISLIALVLGYVIYGRFVSKVFGVRTKRKTPAITHKDGIDYVPMKPWRIFLIQFLNIAGVGPICGAVMGAQFGTASFLWIVFGCIFAGATHDYMAGMLSLRRNGCNLPEILGEYLGTGVKDTMRFVMIVLLVMTGVVFVTTPAILIQSNFTPNLTIYVWVVLIIGYYLVATLLPIDKLIGRIYPVFGLLLLSMAIFIVIAILVNQPHIPEFWEGLQNRHPDAAHNPIFPMMFVSIACGAISGFHATQSPMMARCLPNEKMGRPIFYGAMIVEGVVALIWAAAAAYFFGPDSPVDTAGKDGPQMVSLIANHWFTPFLATITLLGVISAAVTSGDTALRSCRLIVAELFHLPQKSIKSRLVVSIPIFLITLLILVYSMADSSGFARIWRYFGWANQILATVTLWLLSVYLKYGKKSKFYFIMLVPAIFMTMVTGSFLFVMEQGGLGAFIPRPVGYGIGVAITLVSYYFFQRPTRKSVRLFHSRK